MGEKKVEVFLTHLERKRGELKGFSSFDPFSSFTNPHVVWYTQTGNGGYYVRNGRPAKWVSWTNYNGVRIRTGIEPATGRVVTSFPDPYTPVSGTPIQ